MWFYEKRLEYPVHITQPNAKMASYIISQYGGPDGEMGASMRYLSQRYATDNRKVSGLLTDIGVSVPKLHITNKFPQRYHTIFSALLHTF
jgi:Mn-containing catalase